MKSRLYKITQPIAQFITYTVLASIILLAPVILNIPIFPEV